jgi:1,6-anhydro-N-acetylmuramate kinase
MTGTSIDGELDAAMLRIEGHGLLMRVELIASLSWPLGELTATLRAIALQQPLSAGELARAALAFGEVHAEALAQLARAAGVTPHLVVLHGQTVFHAPPITWQLMNPWPVAARLRCRVRYDLRGGNVASGGQGAPITPLADFVLFGDDEQPQAIINLGGFANVTLLPRRSDGVAHVRGFDISACNHLLDSVAQQRLKQPFDASGHSAARGVCEENICSSIVESMSCANSTNAANARRSLGTGDEAARVVALTDSLSPCDACRTIVEAIAQIIARELRVAGHPLGARILLAGGSARHETLCEAIALRSGCPTETTARACAIPVAMREAAAMAILGALADDGVNFSLPAVTGAASLMCESALIVGENAAKQGDTALL